MDHPENNYKIIQQFCLKFLSKFDTTYSCPQLIRKYQTTKDNFMNNSSVWSSFLQELSNCKNGMEYYSKIQYLIYHCLVCLTNSKEEKWQKYYDVVSKLELVPIYPSIGHFKLMITCFQKLQEKLEKEDNYFEKCENRLYFVKNEFLCDFNFYQLHYLHAVFGLENFKLSNYGEMFPIDEEYVWQYQPINVNTPEMKLKLNGLLHNDPINKQYQKNYFIIALEKLLHLDYQDDRKEDITMYYQQLRDIIHILGCPIYNINEKYSKFITSLDDEQVCFVGDY